jgi:hypothetical protein
MTISCVQVDIKLETGDTYLMDTLLMRTQIIPKHSSILQIRLRISLLGMDKQWKQARIADEEDGRIVEHPIPVPFFGVEFD